MDTRAVRQSWANRKVTQPNELPPNVYHPNLTRLSDEEITPRVYRIVIGGGVADLYQTAHENEAPCRLLAPTSRMA